jgi:hypothetical protein
MDPNEEDVCFVRDRFVVNVSMSKADDFEWLVPNQTFVRSSCDEHLRHVQGNGDVG